MNPHTMTYEVLEILPSQTVAKTVVASESYDDCLHKFWEIYLRDGIARLDLVVRERESGKPFARLMLSEAESKEHSDSRGCVYIHCNDYGTLGPCVYCPEYEDKPWAGRECYSHGLTH